MQEGALIQLLAAIARQPFINSKIYSNYDLFREHEGLLDQAIDFFTAEATNPEKFQQIRAICIECDKKYNGGRAESFINLGYLSVSVFLVHERNKANRQRNKNQYC